MNSAVSLADARGERYYSAPEMAVENNLLAFPVFLLSSGNAGRKGWFSYKKTVLHHRPDGQTERVEQEWLVNGSHVWGLTRAVDLDVCMALTEVAEQRGGMPDDGKVWFSLYELKEILGWSRSGENYAVLRESLERTGTTSITSRRAFWSSRRGNFISKTFTLWKPSLNYAWDHKSRTSERHHVKFDELVVESYQDGYIGHLDPGFYRSLRHSTSKRLYMLGDHHCAGGEDAGAKTWEIAPMELMHLMPLGNYDRAAAVERVLDKGHEELVHAGYFDEIEVERGKRNTPLLFRYVQSPAFARKRLGAEIERDPAGAIALAKLRAEKVNRTVAVELVSEFGAAFCTKQAELLPFIPNVKPGKGAGLLVKAIRERWPWEERVDRLPKGKAVASVPDVPTPPEGSEDTGWDLFSGGIIGGSGAAGKKDSAEQERPDYGPLEAGAEKVWLSLCEEYVRRSEPEKPSGWFERFAGYRIEEDLLIVVAPDEEAAGELIDRFGDDLSKLWRERRGERARIAAGGIEEVRAALEERDSDREQEEAPTDP